MPIEVPATPSKAITLELEEEEAPSKEAKDKENKPTRTPLHDIQIIPQRNMASENIKAKQRRLHQQRKAWDWRRQERQRVEREKKRAQKKGEQENVTLIEGLLFGPSCSNIHISHIAPKL
ncbi:hypothetical protein BGX38DRAFT_1277146 [Terfezia claveryi]|nr:hypothetical protein BGX38DRAFT_1277146 [Terfezia claveryi]